MQSTTPPTPPSPAVTKPSTPPTAKKSTVLWWLLFMVIVLAALGFLGKQFLDLERALAAQLQAQEVLKKSIDTRFNDVDAQIKTNSSQLSFLKSNPEILSLAQEEALLLQTQQTVELANQKLQFTGSVDSALALLEWGLNNSDLLRQTPRLVEVKTALREDISDLKNRENSNQVSILIHLSEIITEVDGWPLKGTVKSGKAGVVKPVDNTVQRWWQNIIDTFKPVVEVRPIDAAPPLSELQILEWRNQVRQALTTVQLALIAQQISSARASVEGVINAVKLYTDNNDPRVVAALSTLSQTQQQLQNLRFEPISKTLTALQKLRSARP